MNYKDNSSEEICKAIDVLRRHILDPTKGLPEEVFLFATEITPMVNVDLLVRDEKGRILLTWRDDVHTGRGWHVTGGIIRLKETLEERIIKTALKEFGTTVTYIKDPLEIVPIINAEKKIRSHFFTFVYDCKLPEDFDIERQVHKPGEEGYLKWHTSYPDDMLPVHDFYKKYFL